MFVVVQHIADFEGLDVSLRKHIGRAVERLAIGHIRAGHGAALSRRHVGSGSVCRQAIVEDSASRRTRAAHGLDRLPLRIVLEQVALVDTDGRVLEARHFVRFRKIVHAAVFACGIIERDPEGDRIPRRKAPVGVIEMPGGRIAIGRLDQRLIVPDADAIHTGKSSGDFAQARVEHQLAHSLVRLRQLDALREDLCVVVVGIALVCL